MFVRSLKFVIAFDYVSAYICICMWLYNTNVPKYFWKIFVIQEEFLYQIISCIKISWLVGYECQLSFGDVILKSVGFFFLSNCFYLITICLHIVLDYQVILSNTYNLYTIIMVSTYQSVHWFEHHY